MSPGTRERPRPSTTGRLRARFGTVLGIPVPVVLLALIVSALIGVQLADALEQTTGGSTRTGSTSADSLGGTGKVPVGVPVVTETTLGTEVQRLIDSGTIQPMTSFDSTTCLRALGIPDSILIMEEVAWGGEQSPAWLMVHGPLDRETLRANGGIVSATVVLPSCGTTDDDLTPQQNRLWTGDVMIGSL